jgi:hypothetical protein
MFGLAQAIRYALRQMHYNLDFSKAVRCAHLGRWLSWCCDTSAGCS